jgi:AcrR family transcriptional regulator
MMHPVTMTADAPSTNRYRDTVPSNPPAPIRQYHKGNVAEDLKLAALRILETERVEDLSVRRLAREVGVTPANFYNHFGTLTDLLMELGADTFRERARQMAHIRRTSKTKADAIKRVTLSYLDLALTRPQMFRIMFGMFPEAQTHTGFRDASDESMGEIVEIVYGEKLHDPLNLDETRERCRVAYGLVALGAGLARNVIEGVVPFSVERQADMRHFVESVVESFIDGELPKLAAG